MSVFFPEMHKHVMEVGLQLCVTVNIRYQTLEPFNKIAMTHYVEFFGQYDRFSTS